MSDIICNIDRLPLGLMSFSNIREQNMVYVDKTKFIAKFASQKSPIFFSRPRRFGKSLLINTLACLFSKGLEYFHGLDIEKIWSDKTYIVVHLDFSSFADKKTQKFKESLCKRIIRQFSLNNIYLEENNLVDAEDPDDILDAICQNLSNNSTVLLIDEYDAPLTHHLSKHEELQEITSVLNDFFSTVKQYTDKFRLIFITGVTRTSHVSIFSAFNNLVDISLDKYYNTLLGFTQDDLKQYFDPYIDNAAHILNMSKDGVYKRLQEYYDGYLFSVDANESVYNPWSIINFFKNAENGFYNYWFNSGGVSSILMQYLKVTNEFNFLNYDDRKIYIDKNELSDRYEIDSIPREILLFQTGYLTVKKLGNNASILTFPNTEVEDSLLRLYLMSNNLKPRYEVRLKIDELSISIDNKNINAIVSIFNAILNDCVSILSKIFQDERSVRDIIYAALPQEQYLQKIKERESTKGFSDLELLTQKTHMVIEFKRTSSNRDAQASLDEAIQQMKRKKYGIGGFQNRMLYRVAMVISTEKKAILEEYCKEI